MLETHYFYFRKHNFESIAKQFLSTCVLFQQQKRQEIRKQNNVYKRCWKQKHVLENKQQIQWLESLWSLTKKHVNLLDNPISQNCHNFSLPQD